MPVPGREDRTDIESFFDGVAELRAHLDLRSNDPQQRRRQLGIVARDLLKPRSPRALTRWLGDRLRESLGAKGCSVWLRRGGWRRWYRSGDPQREPEASSLDRLASSDVVVESNDVGVGIRADAGPFGVLWIEGASEIDEESKALLAAIAATVGVALDQSLSVADLARDPQTQLFSTAGFVDQAGPDLRQVPAAKHCHVVLAFRLADQPPLSSRIELSTALGDALRQVLPPGTPLGARDGTDDIEVFAALADFAPAAASTEITALAAEVRRIFEGRHHATDVNTAYQVIDNPIDDLATTTQRLTARLDGAARGSMLSLD